MGEITEKQWNVIKDNVGKEVMQAINDLGIKSVMREKVVEADISKDDVRKMIAECVDSYVRSVDINAIIRNHVDRLVKDEVKKNIKEMFDLGSWDYKANSVLRSAMEKQVVNAFFDNFQFSVNVSRKPTTTTSSTDSD